FSLSVTEHIWSAVSVRRILAVAAVCVVLLVIMLALTVGSARLARLNRADMTVLLFCGSKKSLASGLPMALVFFGPGTAGLIMLPLIIFHQIQLLACAAIATRMSRAEVGETSYG
ncbi:MAG: Sodium Bile acid symporter family protein, partial [Mycobacterium sp.]|nr:Sodium Bile acid symporter family protein [Mycobacterium sp.]